MWWDGGEMRCGRMMVGCGVVGCSVVVWWWDVVW